MMGFKNRRTMGTVVALAFSLVAVGCFPVMVDVSSKGDVLFARAEGVFVLNPKTDDVTALYRSKEGKACTWARWSPDGSRVLFVVAGEGDAPMLGSPGVELQLIGADGKSEAALYTPKSQVGYALWSPDSTKVSVAEIGQQQSEKTGDNMPGLKVVDVTTKKVKDVCKDVAFLHDWIDSNTLVAFSVQSKGENNTYTGELVEINVADGSRKVLAKGVGEQSIWMDASADGKKIAFTCFAAVEADKELQADETSGQAGLYIIERNSGKLTRLDVAGPAFGIFSPDGTHILTSSVKGDKKSLVVYNLKEGKSHQLVSDIATETESMMQSSKAFPTWLGNDRVVFWKSISTHGKSVKAFSAMAIGTDGSGLKNLQARMDLGVAKTIGQ